MAASEQAIEQLLGNFFLADNDFAKLLEDLISTAANLLDDSAFVELLADNGRIGVDSGHIVSSVDLRHAYCFRFVCLSAELELSHTISFSVSISVSIQSSMCHRVRHDIDAHRVGPLLRVLFEVPLANTLAFPAITEVGVMTNEHHHTAIVVV